MTSSSETCCQPLADILLSAHAPSPSASSIAWHDHCRISVGHGRWQSHWGTSSESNLDYQSVCSTSGLMMLSRLFLTLVKWVKDGDTDHKSAERIFVSDFQWISDHLSLVTDNWPLVFRNFSNGSYRSPHLGIPVCNRLKCPLARLSGLQCYNMGHNGH